VGEATTPETASKQTSHRHRNFSMALVGGIVVASVLFGLTFAIDPGRHPALSNLLFTALYPGWFLCGYVIPGSFESSGTENYLVLTVLANSAFYTTLFYTAIFSIVTLARVGRSSYRALNQAVRSWRPRSRQTSLLCRCREYLRVIGRARTSCPPESGSGKSRPWG
jgi:hypothetical protein